LQKLTIVPNGITLDEWQGTPAPLRDDVAQAIAECRAAGQTVVGYAGSMGLPNALDTCWMLPRSCKARRSPS
jgi:hypothetical protein